MDHIEENRHEGRGNWHAITYRRENGCWICTSHKPSGTGYARVRRANVLINLHRYMYEKHVAAIPKGYCVMHTCDNRMCINPKHLRAGTLGENNRDMHRKGRNRTFKLSEAIVRKIKRESIYTSQKARELGIHQTTLALIRDGKIWKDI